MEQKKKHMAGRIVLGVLAAAVAAALVAAPFLLEKRNRAGETKASILSDTVKTGSVTKVLSGAGTLTDAEAVNVTVPSGVEITEYYVSDGDLVREGQPVAKVDKTSVMRAISEVNDTLSELSKQITEASDTKAEETIKATAAGRIKAVYAASGDSVRDVIARHGALAVISMDGKMAADIPAGSLVMGQSVTVVLPSGKSVGGKADSVREGTAVITIDDQYGEIGDAVTVRNAEGEILGESVLYVHSPWKAIAYTGTVSNVCCKKGQKAAAGTGLFRLKATGDSGKYDQLTARRREYEDIAYELFVLYQDGVVNAPCDGRVSGADEALLKQTAAGNAEYVVTLLAWAPGDDPDAEYYNQVGYVTAVSDGSASANIQQFLTQIPDYRDLSTLYRDSESMTRKVTFDPSGVPVYRHNTETNDWDRLSGLTVGDLYVFAYDDSGLAWIIYAGQPVYPAVTPTPAPTQAPTPAPTPKPSQQPEASPGASSGPQQQGKPAGDNKNQAGGGMPSGVQIPTESAEEDEGLYSRTGTTILSVTPQDTMTVTITVDELDILSVKPGQEVTVTMDALPGQSFSADITDVNTTAANEGGNSKYTVEITIPRTEKMLGGMNVSAKITLQTRDNVLTVPTEALSEGETETVIYTGYDTAEEKLTGPVTVKTGLSDGSRTEILSGLSEGDVIWYAYYDRLPAS